MDIYKQAVLLGLTFLTPKGTLSIQQTATLSQTDLKNSIKSVKKLLDEGSDDDELSFLDGTAKEDPLQRLRFDILKDLYLTKKEEAAAVTNARAIKEHNQRISELIANKKDKALTELSVEELEKLYR